MQKSGFLMTRLKWLGAKTHMLKRRKLKEEKKSKREEKMGIKNFFIFTSPCRRRSHVFDQSKLYSELSNLFSSKTLMLGQMGDSQGLNIHPYFGKSFKTLWPS